MKEQEMLLNNFKKCKKALSLIIFLFFFINSQAQYKLKDIPYKLSAINKKNAAGKQGVWFSYYPQDSVISNMQTYKNDTLNGYYEIYWPTGRILQQGYFKNGLLDSIEIAFWEDGITRRIEERFSLGKLNGISRTYDRNGQIIETHKFINDRIDSAFDSALLKSKNAAEESAIDTIITNDKVYTIYTLMKKGIILRDIFYLGKYIFIEDIYDDGLLNKRTTYSATSDNYIESIQYYKNGEKYKTEYYDKSGDLRNEVYEKN